MKSTTCLFYLIENYANNLLDSRKEVFELLFIEIISANNILNDH